MDWTFLVYRWIVCCLVLGNLFLIVMDFDGLRRKYYYAAGIIYIGCQDGQNCQVLMGYDVHVKAWSDFSGYREEIDDRYPGNYSNSMVTACRETIEETIGLVKGLGSLDECLVHFRTSPKVYIRWNKLMKSHFLSYVIFAPDGYDTSLPQRFQLELMKNRTDLSPEEREKSELRWLPMQSTFQYVNETCCENLCQNDRKDIKKGNCDYDKDVDDEISETLKESVSAIVGNSSRKNRTCSPEDGILLRPSMTITWCESLRDGFWDDFFYRYTIMK